MGVLDHYLPRGFADGGDVDQSDAADAPPDQRAYTPAFQQLLARVQPQAGGAPPVAAGPAQPQGGGVLGGAIGIDPMAAEKSARMQAAMMTLNAARRGISASDILAQARDRNSGINVPMMAAAGAMLAPTKTGQFGESLGNALTHGATALHQQQVLDEQTALRAAQMDDTAAYRQQMAQAAGTRAGAYSDNVQNLAHYRDLAMNLKASGLDQAKTLALLKMQLQRDGYDEAAASRIAVATIRADASTYSADRRAEVGWGNVGVRQQVADEQAARWRQSAEAKAIDQQLKLQGFEEAAIRAAMLSASRDGRLWTGKAKAADLVREYLGARNQGSGGGAAPPPAAAQPRTGGAAPAAGGGATLQEPLDTERAQAQQWLKENGDTPENRALLNNRYKQSGVKPFL